MNKANPIFKKIFISVFILFFISSGFYKIPYVDIDSTFITAFKQGLFVIFTIMMAVYLDWRNAIRNQFAFLCGIWLIIHLLNWFIRDQYNLIYIQRIAQVSYVFIFVSIVIQLKKTGTTPMLDLKSWYSPKIIAVLCLVIIFLSYTSSIAYEVAYGFGNNRVNFSIWLSQLVFLSFIFQQEQEKEKHWVIYALMLALPIIVLQVFTGGRTGLLVSISTISYFFYKVGGARFFLLGSFFLSLILYFSSLISPIPDVYPGTGIFRSLEIDQDGSFFHVIDRLSSYRLSIIISAVSTLNLDSLITGLGVMNFKGWAIGTTWDMHNIYLKALGEFGILGFIIQFVLLFLPYNGKPKTRIDKDARMFCTIFLFIGLFHPNLLLTAISTCMIYWLCYAEAYYATEGN